MNYSFELIHTAMNILDRRSKQMDERDDELYHYGRKGMKWGEDIFAEDEESRRRRAGAPSSETGAQKAARLKKELLLRRAENTAKKEGGWNTQNDKRLDDMRREVNKSPNKAIYGATRVRDSAKDKVNGMITIGESPVYDDRGLTIEERRYNNERVVPYSERSVNETHFYDNDEGDSKRRAGQRDFTQETGAEKAARMKKEALLRKSERAAEKEGKAPYKDPYEKPEDKPEVKIPDSEYYKKKYGGIGKGLDYANKKMAEAAANNANSNNKPTNQNVENKKQETVNTNTNTNANVDAEQKVENKKTDTKTVSSFSDISNDARNTAIDNINASNLASDIPILMLGGDAAEEECAELDRIINESIDDYVKSAGLSYDDPNVAAQAQALKDDIIEEVSNVIVTQYYALLNQQQASTNQAIQDANNAATMNPATQPWMFGM